MKYKTNKDNRNTSKDGNSLVSPADVGNDSDAGMSRRDLLNRIMFAGLGLAGLSVLPSWTTGVIAQNQTTVSTMSRSPKNAPFIKFTKSKDTEGAVGPFGEVRVFEVENEILPVYISAADNSAVMDMTGRNPFVRYGADATAITLTAAGVEFGKGNKLKPWSAEVVKELIDALSKDRKKARAAMMLRSALHTAYPVAVAQMKSSKQTSGFGTQPLPAFITASYSKNSKNKRMGAAIQKSSANFTQPNFWNCTTELVTETVTRTVTETTEVIKTALQQVQECYDREIRKSPCKDIPIGGAMPCAAAICAGKAFADVVIGFVEVVVGVVTEEVVRTVVKCNPKLVKVGGVIIKEWLSPWIIDQPQRVSGLSIGNVSTAADAPFNAENVKKALEFLKSITDYLGEFGKCFLDAKWSFAEINTKIDFGGKDLAIPYGIKVCLSSACARKLTVQETFASIGTAWATALSAIAALDAGAAASLAVIGIAPAAAVTAAAAALPPAVITAATIILCFMLVALVWGTAISAQLSLHQAITNNFDDGKVCIEHPTFAAQLLQLLTLGFIPATLIPPIVTG